MNENHHSDNAALIENEEPASTMQDNTIINIHPARNTQGRVELRSLHDDFRDEATTKIGVIIISLIHIPQILVTFGVLCRHWDTPVTCDRPIRDWVFLSGLRQTGFVLVSVALYFSQCEDREHQVVNGSTALYAALGKLLLKCKYGLEMVGLAWFIIGNMWVFASTNCESRDPGIYHLALALIFINYAMIFLPCVILVIVLPIACFCLPCIIRLAARYHSRRRPVGVSLEDIDKLESVKYSEGMHRDDEAMCCICLCDYESGDDLRVLPCRHHFHCNCVDEWLALNGSCPNCRSSVGNSNNEDQEENVHSQRNPNSYELLAGGDGATIV